MKNLINANLGLPIKPMNGTLAQPWNTDNRSIELG
jgi:hypothetical protein